jgi:UrcA family protein
MSKLFNVSLSAAAAVALLAGAATPAFAQSDPISVAVSYADLDISHASGAAVLFQRIQAAATRACGDMPYIRDLGRMAEFETCRTTAVHDAVVRVGSPLLTAMIAPPAAPTRVASR